MKRWSLLIGVAVVGLVGCAASPPPVQPDAGVFRDALFEAPDQRPDVSHLFELSPAMRRHLTERIEPQVWRKGAQMALLDALYTQGDLRLEYDAVRTRTAAEAFDARKGNCLSLVIMTAAFARELGLSVRFNEVLDVPVVEASGSLTFVIGHVNLALGDGSRLRQPGAAQRSWLLVDFVPGQDLRHQRTRELDESRIRAQFMNNRAAEELARGRVNEAYWWLRGAAAQDPRFANLYNTLGVVYRHRGAMAEAERALQLAQDMDPGNEHVAGNLAGLRQAPGPALAIADEAALTTPRFAAVRQALDLGQLEQAVQMLQGELGLTPRNAEAHHLLAIASARLGKVDLARHHLAQAAAYSTAGAQRQLYAGKLERLKAHAASGPVLQ
jgi:Flp pilus assembly protein TadD